MTGCGTRCHGLVQKGEIDQRLHFIILEVFPNLIILWFYNSVFRKHKKAVHQKTAKHNHWCTSLLSPAFCIDPSGITDSIFINTSWLGLPLQLLTPNGGGVLAQTWLRFPSKIGRREGATAQSCCYQSPGKLPSGRDAVMGKRSLHDVNITQERYHRAAEPREVIGCWLKGVCLFPCVVSAHKVWRSAVAAWGHPGTL